LATPVSACRHTASFVPEAGGRYRTMLDEITRHGTNYCRIAVRDEKTEQETPTYVANPDLQACG
jgi:hypothetical protein